MFLEFLMNFPSIERLSVTEYRKGAFLALFPSMRPHEVLICSLIAIWAAPLHAYLVSGPFPLRTGGFTKKSPFAGAKQFSHKDCLARGIRGALCSANPYQGPTEVCNGMRDIADRYDAFLLDQWGVMHDGSKAHEGAIECMKQLAAAGKKVVLISNSSKRVGTSMKKLDKMGFDSSKLVGIVTGGDVAWEALRDRKVEPYVQLGKQAFVFGNGDDDEEYVRGAGLEFAEIQSADFILARGMFTMHDSEDVLKRTGGDKYDMWDMEATRCLQIGAGRYIPMLVTNPDFVRPDGNDSPMPGTLGSLYEQILASNMCGERIVYYVGKPHHLVYEKCFDLLKEATGKEIDRSRVCAVGDSMLHDIAGAKRNGINSVFIADGIHAEALGIKQAVPGQQVTAAKVDDLRSSLRMTILPTHTIPHFSW